jgi:thioredoxin 1
LFRGEFLAQPGAKLVCSELRRATYKINDEICGFDWDTIVEQEMQTRGNMKIARLGWILPIFLFSQPALFAQTTLLQSHAKAISETGSASSFEPLDRWRAAVLAGDKTSLMGLYMISPPAQTKTPQGEIRDPGEEPMFWSSLRSAGLDRLDVKILEAKTLQPGLMALVLRVETGLKARDGEKAGVISASQVWVQWKGDWRIASTQRGDLVAKPPMRLPEPAKPNTQLYPPPEKAPSEIASALSEASKDHKRVLLVFGGNWCYDCHVLDTTFRSKAFAPVVNANYHVVHINIGNMDQNTDLANKYGIPLNKGVPSLAILDPNGKLVVSQKQGEFESTVKIGPEDVLQFLKKWKPQHAS